MGLLLGAHEQQALAVLRQLTDEVVSLLQLLHGLLQVDDIDPIALSEDVGSHLGVPPTGLVAEVYAGLQQLFHRYDCHLQNTSLVLKSPLRFFAGLLPPPRCLIGANSEFSEHQSETRRVFC